MHDVIYTESSFTVSVQFWSSITTTQTGPEALAQENKAVKDEFCLTYNKSLWVTPPGNKKVMHNPHFAWLQALALWGWQLTFLSHRVGHCGPCLRVPVGLLVVGSIASQRSPCHRRVFDPFCNSERHMFSRWSLDRCKVVLLEQNWG